MFDHFYFSYPSAKSLNHSNQNTDKICNLSKDLEKVVQYWANTNPRRIINYTYLDHNFNEVKYTKEIDIVKIADKKITIGEVKCSCNKVTLQKAINQLYKTVSIIEKSNTIKTECIIIYFNLDNTKSVGLEQRFKNNFNEMVPDICFDPKIGFYKLLVLNPREVFEYGYFRGLISNKNVLNEALQEANSIVERRNTTKSPFLKITKSKNEYQLAA